jgi:hypothetical protein
MEDNMKKSSAIILGGLVLMRIFALNISASEKGESSLQKKKWREAFVSVDRQVMTVEAIEGTSIGIMKQRGFAFFENGQVAAVTAWFTFEGQGRDCEYKGYLHYKFEDGSTQTTSFQGHGNPVGKQQGIFKYLKGTGRFQGIQGKGMFSAKGFPPEADLYVDAEAEYMISEK